MEIKSQSIATQLDNANKFCIDWNSFGLIAYASHNTISIVDSYSMKTVQTIYNPKCVITKLKWSSFHSESKNQKLFVNKLACAEESGNLSVWNPNDAKLINEFNESNYLSNQKIVDIKWFYNIKMDQDYLIILYNSNKFIIWEPVSAVKLWTKNMSEQIAQFAIDPHTFGRIAVLGSNLIQFINIDVASNAIVEKSSSKFFLMNQDNTSNLNSQESSKTGMTIFTNYWSNMLLENGDQKQKPLSKASSKVSLNDCFQIEFHSLAKNIMFLVYSREIFIFELTVNQTIGYIQLEKSQSAVIKLYSCLKSDNIYLMHENSSISVYGKKENTTNDNMFIKDNQTPIGEQSFNEVDSSFFYALLVQSDQIRLSKTLQVFGFCVCPVSEKKIAMLLSDGRILKFSLFNKKIAAKSANNGISSTGLKITLTSMTHVLPQMPTIVKPCPALTKKNSKIWAPLIGLGCNSGFLYIFNLNKNLLVKKTLVFSTHPVTGIEWITMNTLIIWSSHTFLNASTVSTSHQDTSNNNVGVKQNNMKNELIYHDLRTGESSSFRNMTIEESPIVTIKISNLKQYLAILFRDQPLEVWDIKSFALIKKISRKSPTIRLLEWFLPDSNQASNQVNSETEDKKIPLLSSENQASSELKAAYSNSLNIKENFICVDEHGLLYSFTVEANSIRDGGKLLPDDPGLHVNLNTIAMKKYLILFGDQDGNIIKWDVKTKVSKILPFKQRGEIKKLKFAPGKENLLLLIFFSDIIEIVEANSFENVSSFKSATSLATTLSGTKVKIIDCDWCSSDKIIVLFSDSIIRIFDLNFKQQSNLINCIPSLSRFTDEQISSKNIDADEIRAFKNFFMEAIDNGSNEVVFKEKEQDAILNSYFMTNKSSQLILRDLIKNLNDQFSKLFEKILSNNSEKENCTKEFICEKAVSFCIVSNYFNFGSFESKFWTIFCDSLDKKFVPDSKFMCEKIEFKKNEYQKLKFYRDKQHLITTKNNKLVQDLIFCNELDLVFNILIETEPQAESYLDNYMKACLVSSIKNAKEDSNYKTSVKLIATNLIANSKLNEGVELLVLIGLVYDACRYLQDNGKWEKAAWLAKMRLNDEEYFEIIKRWCDHLHSIDRKDASILLLLSCKKYLKVLEVLNSTSYFELAYFFMKTCVQLDFFAVPECYKSFFMQNLKISSEFLESIAKEQAHSEQKYLFKIAFNYFHFKKKFQ